MTATTAPSAAPSYAIPCWVDGHHLFFELRGIHGPHVVSFQRYELSKALAILFQTFETEGAGQPYTLPEQSPRKVETVKAMAKDGISQADRDAAAAVLKSLRLK